LKNFPPDIKFKFEWRTYQERVLNELEEHLNDNHLHIIAPPGSGKTVLGLEVAIRLNKPTLILTPTIAIRNQWIQRFTELFLQIDFKPDWISRDIKNPGFLTVSTYQGLHAAIVVEDKIDSENPLLEDQESITVKPKQKNIISILKSQNIGTIVVDEAHHLKNAWWQSLSEVKKALNPTIVGLTATPPYDVSRAEWHRYINLNGPVDTEISVPELVVEGDLCPHQDFVMFSRPTDEEFQKISIQRIKIEKLFNDIKRDETLIESLLQHPIFLEPTLNLEWIYTNLEYYSAILIFLNAIEKEITEEHLDVIGGKNFTLPELTYEWLELLLTFYLYKDSENFEKVAHQEKLINKLKRAGAIERRSINLRHNNNINRTLRTSISKIKSIDQIVDVEHNQLKQDLRMVILTDYIRKEYLVEGSQNELELNKMGVMSIFEQLRRTNDRNIRMGVLTGSLIIIPKTALKSLSKFVSEKELKELSTSVLPYDNNYLIINSTVQIKHNIVHFITQIFEAGQIEVLIGTKALLGEGWDAPAINSLVLASFVGSYVQSNQMRGRAIRTNLQKNNKTSNIWHLVCLDPTVMDGGDDIQLLKRRFKAFVGVSFKKDVNIENGIGRLNLPEELSTVEDVLNINNTMINFAAQRDLLREKWELALKQGVSLVEEIKIPFPPEKNYKSIKTFYYNRTIKSMFAMLGSGLAVYGFESLQSLGRMAKNIKSIHDLYTFLIIIGGIGIFLFGGLAFNAFRYYLKYRDITKDIQKIGEALLETLIKIGEIHTNLANLKVVSEIDENGAIYCHVEGGTTFERSLFIKSLVEIIEPVENPRYLVIRKSLFLSVISQKDYHSVPENIARRKQYAVYFANKWAALVGSCKLVYTRTIEGRKILLHSRINSLASEFTDKTERVNKWR
jgi:superfamily II DNA or RNA helicase